MFRMGHWSIYASGTPSVIVWVENKAANEGESCEAISGVVAAISYRDSDGRTLAQITRAYSLPFSRAALALASAAFAVPTRVVKPAASCAAISARILRSSALPASFSPLMNVE